MQRIQLVTGKGGVGKSTMVAAYALAAAECGQTPLIVELGHRASIEALLGRSIGFEPREVAPGVHAMRAELEPALVDYVAAQVRVRALAKRIVHSPTLNRFFHAAPAVAEVATLHLLERLVEGDRFDPILVDLDSTGHARMFLALPDVFEGLAGAGPLRTLLDASTALLRDPTQTVLHLVSIPEALPVRETVQLLDDLERARTVRVGALIINRTPTPPLSDADVRALDDLEPDADVLLARRMLHRYAHQTELVDQLRARHSHTVTIAERGDLAHPHVGPALHALGRELLEALEPGSTR